MEDPTQTSRVVSYYWRQVSRYKKLLVGILLCMPLAVLINSFLTSLIIAGLLTRLSDHHYTHNIWRSFGPQLVFYVILVLLGTLAWRIADRFVFGLEGNVERDMAEEVFAHMLDETADFHANNFSGSLVSQNSKLLSGYIRMADTTIFQVFPLFFSIVFSAIILVDRSWIYTVLLVIFSIVFIVFSFRASRPVRRLSSAHAANESEQTGYLADAITNVMAIKSFARGEYERKRFSKTTNATKSSLSDFMRAQGKLFNQMGLITQVISVTALFISVISVVLFKANIGTVFLIISYTGSITSQLFNFSNSSLRNYNRSIGDAHDMVTKLGHLPEVQDPINPQASKIKKGEINFDNVTFTHTDASDSILNNFNLGVQAGQKIGLVGHSGSGKSTLVRLLLRFSDIDSGEILIDDQNIAKITQDDLHAKIAYVPQEPLLFHRTIAENITYGLPKASQAMLDRAAKQAHATEFIDTLPSGYETLVGERGVKLSGGQRQRVAIARALLKDAPILVLDEATSSLDSESEVLIQDALWKLMEGRTAIVIAHRLSTIQKMDRIIVLDNGRVIEDGTHKQLLELKGTYAKLWGHQSGGFMDDN